MTLPKSLRILGLEYPLLVVTKEEIEDEAFGAFRPVAQEIRVRSDLDPCLQAAIVLHEAQHAIDYAAALNLSERQVTINSRMLYTFLLDNPELLEVLLEQAKNAKLKTP